MTPIRVLLADDHSLVRAGLRALLASMEGMQVVGEAGNGREALIRIAADPPDVVLMAISMPEMNGLDAAAQIAHDFPGTRVIMLTRHTEQDYVLQALQAGAAGYLIKDSSVVELETAVRMVARGEMYLSPAVSKQVVREYLRRVGAEAQPPDLLTRRQREVLQLLAEGNDMHEIARKLNISAKTVEAHRAQLMQRLGIHDLAGLVRYAIHIGLINPP